MPVWAIVLISVLGAWIVAGIAAWLFVLAKFLDWFKNL